MDFTLTEEMKYYEGFEIRKLSNRKACASISSHTSRLHTNIKVDMETIFIQFFFIRSIEIIKQFIQQKYFIFLLCKKDLPIMTSIHL
jgi:hypothetical protein